MRSTHVIGRESALGPTLVCATRTVTGFMDKCFVESVHEGASVCESVLLCVPVEEHTAHVLDNHFAHFGTS